jgi:hypothetical protein
MSRNQRLRLLYFHSLKIKEYNSILQCQFQNIYIRIYGDPTPEIVKEPLQHDEPMEEDEEEVLFVGRDSHRSSPPSALIDMEIVEDANSTMAFLGLEESDEEMVEEVRGKTLVHLESRQVAPQYRQEVDDGDLVVTGEMSEEVFDWQSNMPGRWS